MIDFSQMTDFTSTFKFKKKICFLDVDGVLNGYNRWNTLGWNIVCKFNSEKLRNWYRELTDPCGVHEKKVKLLAKIVHRTGAKVVMSSTWRHSYWKFVNGESDHIDDIKKLADLLNKYNIEVIDITPKSPRGRRDDEIIAWLSRHEEEVDSFVILDDERFDLECFADKELVQTSSVPKGVMIKGFDYEDTGLKRKHVKKAIKILNGGSYDKY
jgi:hypothetical protein